MIVLLWILLVLVALLAAGMAWLLSVLVRRIEMLLKQIEALEHTSAEQDRQALHDLQTIIDLKDTVKEKEDELKTTYASLELVLNA